MDSMILYESEELSLFDRDVLGLAPAFSEDTCGLDGIKTLRDDTTGPNVVYGIDHQMLNTDLGLLDPLGAEWHDSKMDLLDLLQDDTAMSTASTVGYSDLSLISEVPEPKDPSELAVEVLKNMAEETSHLLHDSGIGSADASLLEPSNDEDLEVSAAQLLNMLADGSIDTDFQDVSASIDNNAILSPMSPQDVESILSSGPTSPMGSSQDLSSVGVKLEETSSTVASCETSLSTADLAQLLAQVQGQANNLSPGTSQDMSDMPYSPSSHSDSDSDPDYQVTTSRPKPYSRKGKAKSASKEEIMLERKLRKKQQNKDAATRYRQKKRMESKNVNVECEQLESRNKELKDSVEQMTREISYLKNLLTEVYKAKGIIA